MIAWLLSCSLKAAILLAASWCGAALLRRGSAAARHQIWTLGVLGALLLPVLCWVAPTLASLGSDTTTLARSALDGAAVYVTAGAATTSAATWPWLATGLAIGWAAGALVVAFQCVRAQLAACRLVKAAEPHVAESWTVALDAATASLALAVRVQLRRSATIGSPMTIGVLRPRVVLPAAADAWSPQRLRAVLVHELGHVRRRDTLIQLAAQLGCALYWWNPLAWLAAARLRSEREHACDDLVLGAGTLASSYATDLLDVARSISRDVHAAICMVDRSSTEARLHRILDATTPRWPLRTRFRLVACGLALASAVTLACTSAPPPSAPPPSAAASRGTLSLGDPSVRDWDMLHPPVARQGGLDLSLVATEVKHRLGPLEQCYERRLAIDPTLSGTVVLHWTIAETGKVADQCITKDTLGDEAVTACVNELVAEGDFPAPHDGSVDVSFPFVFTAHTPVATR
ncbi:MAG: M56 family metallopeptidase [Kofleriaceae bacterium]